jgi:hypothetical protein
MGAAQRIGARRVFERGATLRAGKTVGFGVGGGSCSGFWLHGQGVSKAVFRESSRFGVAFPAPGIYIFFTGRHLIFTPFFQASVYASQHWNCCVEVHHGRSVHAGRHARFLPVDDLFDRTLRLANTAALIAFAIHRRSIASS